MRTLFANWTRVLDATPHLVASRQAPPYLPNCASPPAAGAQPSRSSQPAPPRSFFRWQILDFVLGKEGRLGGRWPASWDAWGVLTTGAGIQWRRLPPPPQSPARNNPVPIPTPTAWKKVITTPGLAQIWGGPRRRMLDRALGVAGQAASWWCRAEGGEALQQFLMCALKGPRPPSENSRNPCATGSGVKRVPSAECDLVLPIGRRKSASPAKTTVSHADIHCSKSAILERLRGVLCSLRKPSATRSRSAPSSPARALSNLRQRAMLTRLPLVRGNSVQADINSPIRQIGPAE